MYNLHMVKTWTVSLNTVFGLCLVKYASQEALNSPQICRLPSCTD